MCDCITKINEHLAQHNTQVTPTLAVREGEFKFVGVRIHTHKINEHQAGKAQSLTAAFCPFCGEKYA